VLVVEDDASIRNLVTRYLSAQGYSVSAEGSAEGAFRALKRLQAPILLVDYSLPAMNGLDLVEALRGARHDFEAVLMTAHADVDSLSRSLTLGVFRCIHKPFHNADVLSAVAGAANRLWLRLDLRARKVELEARNAELEATVNELHKAQQERMLGERLASIGRLAAGVAHEINSPLAAVIANLALAAEEMSGPSDPSMRYVAEMLHDARDAAERVRTIVRDLKTLSRADEERVGAVDLRRTIEASINMVSNEIRHRARLVRDYGETAVVEANEARLGQVVLNLLINAAQAIPEGNVSRNEIRIVTATSGDRVMLEIRDTGGGMSPDVRDHIFDPFFTTKPVGVGTGLGLSICHGIISSYGGEIQVESVVGVGSVFRVFLPAAKSIVEDVHPAPAAASVRRARVLAVDDDPAMLRTLARVFAPEHDITTVLGARDALDRLANGEHFDVILCDLMMPDMTGMQLHEELSRTSPERASAVIFLTGGAFTPDAQAFFDRVPNLRIAKPFDLAQLRTIVADRVRHS